MAEPPSPVVIACLQHRADPLQAVGSEQERRALVLVLPHGDVEVGPEPLNESFEGQSITAAKTAARTTVRIQQRTESGLTRMMARTSTAATFRSRYHAGFLMVRSVPPRRIEPRHGRAARPRHEHRPGSLVVAQVDRLGPRTTAWTRT